MESRIPEPRRHRSRPAFFRLHVDERGNPLVRVDGATLGVYDPDGLYLGTVEGSRSLRDGLALPVFVNGEVYGLATDSLGVEYVVRARIARPDWA